MENLLAGERQGYVDRILQAFHFEITPKWADQLLHLVLIGQKKARSSSLWGYEAAGKRWPRVGDLSIVTDWEGKPKCVIETVRVTTPFRR